MDGPHDLGGKQGFGPIDVDEEDVPFHADWEGRMWGISRSSGAPGMTIDWWRHIRETIDPVDYLTRPYFDSWAQTELASYIDSGVFTLGEAASGKSDTPSNRDAQVQDVQEAVAADRTHGARFDRPIDEPPRYAVGNSVIAKMHASPHHTRLPAYARGHGGVVHAHHGGHVFPDENAKGVEIPQHLYTIAFQASDLWPEAAGSKDRVFLDLWESYLDPA